MLSKIKKKNKCATKKSRKFTEHFECEKTQ